MALTLLALAAGVALAPMASAADAAWPTLAESPHGKTKKGPRDAALVIAIEEYAFTPEIPGAVANGKRWVNWLRDERGVQHVKPLYNEQATREEILRAAAGINALMEPGGRLWVVFIGHGAPSATSDDGLLVGVDAQQKAANLQERSVTRGELLAALDGRQADTVMVIDACFSGRDHEGEDLAPGLAPVKLVSEVEGGTVTVLTAAEGDQFSGPLSDRSRPAFSYLALGAVRGWADDDGDGTVSAAEVRDYTRDALLETIVGRNQTPTLEGPDAVLSAGAREKGPELNRLTAAAFPDLPTGGGPARRGIPKRMLARGLGFTGATVGVGASLLALRAGALAEAGIRDDLTSGESTVPDVKDDQAYANTLYGVGYAGLAASTAVGVVLLATTGRGASVLATPRPGGLQLGWRGTW